VESGDGGTKTGKSVIIYHQRARGGWRRWYENGEISNYIPPKSPWRVKTVVQKQGNKNSGKWYI